MRRALVKLGGVPSVQCKTLPIASARSQSDILVRVHAAGINPLDRVMVSRNYGSELLDMLRGSEFVLGQEFSGVCVAAGKNVMDVRMGDEVFGAVDPWAKSGTLTEMLRVNEADVARKPKVLTHEQAAVLPFAAMTVWRDVIEHARSRRAKSAVVFGAKGKVGSVTVAMLETLVPGMQRVVGVGREGLENDDKFDIVVDATSSQGSPLDLQRHVNPSGLYCTFNGPWLSLTAVHGLMGGTAMAAHHLLEKKAQGWTSNGSSYKWGLMRGGGAKALRELSKAIDRGAKGGGGALFELATRPVHVLSSLEEAESKWGSEETASNVSVVRVAQ